MSAISIHSDIDLSVILAVRNEQSSIAKTLTDLLNQEVDYRRIEVLVADGCSDDATAAIITGICARYPHRPIRLFRNRLQRHYAGVNRLVQRSRGRFALIIDGHTRFPPHFLAANLTVIAENHADLIGGQLETRAASDDAMAQAIAACVAGHVGDGARFGDADGVPFPCVDRAVFEWVGLFREELASGADAEFIARCRRHGVRIHLDSRMNAVVFTETSLAAVARKAYRRADRRASQRETARFDDAASLAFALATVLPPIGGFFAPVLWVIWPFVAIAGCLVACGVAYRRAGTQRVMNARERLLATVCELVIDGASVAGWLHGRAVRRWHPLRRQQRPSPPRLGGPLADALEPLPLPIGHRTAVPRLAGRPR